MATIEYPTDALPESVQTAVTAVASILDVPVSVSGSIALAVLTMPAQGHVNVRRDAAGVLPISLFHLVLAESGDRKSTVEKHFLRAYETYNREQRAEGAKLLERYKHEQAEIAIQENALKRKLETITLAKLKPGNVEAPDEEAALRSELDRLYASKRQPPRLPLNLRKMDVTVEDVVQDLGAFWPVASVIQGEGGLVLGGYSMKRDSLIYALSIHNTLYDGQLPTRGRVKSRQPLALETELAKSGSGGIVRYSMCVQVQPGVFHAFLASGGTAAIMDSIGWFARFLTVSVPPRTQGRVYQDPGGQIPGADTYDRLLRQLLELDLPLDADGHLAPRELVLTPEAKRLYAEYHDATSRMSAQDGILHPVKPAAEKTAEQALRIAGLLQFVIDHRSEAISADTMTAGIRLAAWHLWEAFRIMRDRTLPKSIADAKKIEEWLLGRQLDPTQGGMKKTQLQQYGRVRDGHAFRAALSELTDRNRARVVTRNGQQMVEINPALYCKPAATNGVEF